MVYFAEGGFYYFKFHSLISRELQKIIRLKKYEIIRNINAENLTAK